MNVGILAARRQLAQERLLLAAGTLSTRFQLGAEAAALDAAKSKDPAVQMLLQTEAVAALLEGMVLATKPATASPPPAAPAAPKAPAPKARAGAETPPTGRPGAGRGHSGPLAAKGR